MVAPTANNEYPDQVTLIEVGPRDGFQFESKIIPTSLKVEIISGLVAAGLKQIQVTSFVHPQRVPQMADAESLLRALPVWENVDLSGLVLNRQGLERAHRAGLRQVEISISASDTHSRKNTGMPLDEALRAVTQTPARMLGLDDQIGTLGAGRQADLVLVSHNHWDHIDARYLRSLPEETPVVAPLWTSGMTRLKGGKNVVGLRPWQRRQFGPVAIIAVPAIHLTLALGFVLAHKAVDTAIVGTSDPEHMKANVRMAESQLTISEGAVQELQRRFEEMGSSWSQET